MAHGCSAGMVMESDLDVIMVGTWILCGNGYESDLDVIMVGTWMLCGNGYDLIWILSVANGYGLIWTLSWLAHGCSAGMDMV